MSENSDIENFTEPYWGVSTNNIPIADKKEYNIQLIRSVNRFANRVRWKIFFLLDPKAKGMKKETFGLRAEGCTEERHVPERV